MSVASVSGSATPAHGSSAVKRAMLHALATVSRSAAALRSACWRALARAEVHGDRHAAVALVLDGLDLARRTDTDRPTSMLMPPRPAMRRASSLAERQFDEASRSAPSAATAVDGSLAM